MFNKTGHDKALYCFAMIRIRYLMVKNVCEFSADISLFVVLYDMIGLKATFTDPA